MFFMHSPVMKFVLDLGLILSKYNHKIIIFRVIALYDIEEVH